ncbi:MAG: hypothetical protein H8D24_06825 [Gammaproteobacteria bacterium]|uniref:Uncharacterized protein n=1 Tax=Candidatus Thiopontia autotrophica TaxID=2841688 RepID=A0A8J6PBI7_9GAMM|nr:hypothetical protein [Candidatus Thiopontia autotrophica]MBL6969137.1 hypothetical protein [Gammaproteobacteria bacterium]
MDNNTDNPFMAEWSEQGHTVCLGHWQISYKGKPIQLPLAKRDEEMGTFGIYSYLYPDDPEFAEGLEEDEWILENMEWITNFFETNNIPLDEQHLSWFYQAINQNDWSCGSCGGCI